MCVCLSAATVETLPGKGLVYVNYGREEDFEMLKELGVDVSGHIVIARYGKIFRGNKVRRGIGERQRNIYGSWQGSPVVGVGARVESEREKGCAG